MLKRYRMIAIAAASVALGVLVVAVNGALKKEIRLPAGMQTAVAAEGAAGGVAMASRIPKAVSAPPQIRCEGRTAGIFYGVGGHVQQGGSYDDASYHQQVSQLRDLGMTMYAQDVSDKSGADKVAELARVAKPECVGVLVALTPPPVQDNADEEAAYRAGEQLGFVTATTLKGLVHYYQVGNEFDNVAIIGGHGNQASDYDNAKFEKARGSIRGMIAGVKTADPSAQIVLCALSWLHFGFSDMLRAGTQPDGSSGHPVPEWDITAWHWYSDMGDITCAGGRLLGSTCMLGTNVLSHLQVAYGKPIWITEFGARPDLTEDKAASYLVGEQALAGFVANAKKYNIQSVAMYELYDDKVYVDGNYGVVAQDGKTLKPRYHTLKKFIETHAMP